LVLIKYIDEEAKMGQKSTIEWTDCTWNPVTGCQKISPGCTNCYAETFAERWRGIPGHPYEQGFDLKIWPERLLQPLSWKQPRIIFVNSMSDLFHHDIPQSYIERVFQVMQQASWHTFQILTKRAERLLEISKILEWPENVWMGVSVENEDYKWRIEYLRETPAKTKFLSVEPLLGPIKRLPLSKMDWVIVGGESGPFARPVEIEWVRDIRDQCLKKNVPFFFKQWGGVQKKKNGRELDGTTWNQLPKGLAVSA